MRAIAASVLAASLALLSAPATGADPQGAEESPFEDAIATPPSVAERVEEIRRRVQEAVVYPELARRRGITGVTRIRFAVDATGRASQVETVDTSGSTLLDEAAEKGARDASDLPYVYGQLEVPIRFALSGR